MRPGGWLAGVCLCPLTDNEDGSGADFLLEVSQQQDEGRQQKR